MRKFEFDPVKFFPSSFLLFSFSLPYPVSSRSRALAAGLAGEPWPPRPAPGHRPARPTLHFRPPHATTTPCAPPLVAAACSPVATRSPSSTCARCASPALHHPITPMTARLALSHHRPSSPLHGYHAASTPCCARRALSTRHRGRPSAAPSRASPLPSPLPLICFT